MRLSRHLGYGFVLVAVLCVGVLFFFPAIQGPYSAIHGPVTVLVSLKAKLCLSLVLLLAATRLSARAAAVIRRALQIPFDGASLVAASYPELHSVLRC